MENNSSKILSGVLLVAFFIVLPGVSYFYLQTGLDYHKERKAELDSLGQMPAMIFADHLGDTLTTADLKGNMSVLGFFSSDCGDSCQLLMERFQFIQNQFFDYNKLMLLSCGKDSIETLQKKLKLLKANEDASKWSWLTSNDDEKYNAFADNFEINYQDGFASQVALVDTSLTIRRYYDMQNDNDMNRLIIHLAKFAPRPRGKVIQFAREKEK